MNKPMKKIEKTKEFFTDLDLDSYTRLVDDSENYDGSSLVINQKKLKNFGSCSYLGLDGNQEIRQGAIDAVQLYGTQFSFAPIYVETSLYRELKQLFEQIYKAPTILTTRTTIGHFAAIPIIAGEEGIFVEDRQVHNSVKMALRYSLRGDDYLQTINHNDMSELEDILKNNGCCPVW
ncbi:MAG: hypothetical protein GY754_41935 [bacterium]|nr:hypothetical protein [bacterium]